LLPRIPRDSALFFSQVLSTCGLNSSEPRHWLCWWQALLVSTLLWFCRHAKSRVMWPWQLPLRCQRKAWEPLRSLLQGQNPSRKPPMEWCLVGSLKWSL
jgi:hypothetical protein